MTKPSKLPEWDTTQVNSTEPDQDHKDEGWLTSGGVPEKPPFQTFNYWMNEVFRWIKAWNDDGLPSWDSATDYPVGGFTVGSDGDIYRSLQTPNVNQDPISTPTYWLKETTAINANTGQTIVLSVNDVAALTINTNRSISASPDEDVTFELGRATLSGAVSDTMVLGHVDNAVIANAAISQTASGQTSVNSASGQAVTLKEDGIAIFSLLNNVIDCWNDERVEATLGKSKIGDSGTDSATFSHVDITTPDESAIMQLPAGEVRIGTPTGQDINFRNNGTEFASFAPTVLGYASDVDATAVFGRVRLYSNGADAASFSHYDRSGANDYAVAQDSAGHTHINAPTGSSIYFRVNNVEVGRFAGTTLTLSDISVTSNQHLGTWSATGATAGIWFNVGGGCYFSSTNSGQQTVWQFSNPNGIVGSIRTNASATVYNTSSDPRLKSKFASVSDDRIMGIINGYATCAGEFHFLADDLENKILGFDAHKVADLQIGSEMATEGKGKRTAKLDGSKVTPASVDQSKCTPALILAMDMALKKIEQLEIKLATMEAK